MVRPLNCCSKDWGIRFSGLKLVKPYFPLSRKLGPIQRDQGSQGHTDPHVVGSLSQTDSGSGVTHINDSLCWTGGPKAQDNDRHKDQLSQLKYDHWLWPSSSFFFGLIDNFSTRMYCACTFDTYTKHNAALLVSWFCRAILAKATFELTLKQCCWEKLLYSGGHIGFIQV